MWGLTCRKHISTNLAQWIVIFIVVKYRGQIRVLITNTEESSLYYTPIVGVILLSMMTESGTLATEGLTAVIVLLWYSWVLVCTETERITCTHQAPDVPYGPFLNADIVSSYPSIAEFSPNSYYHIGINTVTASPWSPGPSFGCCWWEERESVKSRRKRRNNLNIQNVE